jgi:putative phosphoribosyl transferase
MLFEDRRDAGRRLAAELTPFSGPNSIVLSLPRGGVAVGYEVATTLGIDMDVLISRKIGAPGNPELAIGAVAEIDGLWVDQSAIELLGVSPEYVNAEAERQRQEIGRMIQLYRQGRNLTSLAGRTAIVVDDGIATGYTMLAAVKGVRESGAGSLVVAVPVAAPEPLWRLANEADRVVCLVTPVPFYAVGYHYVGFDQLSDEDVARYLEDARQQLAARNK